MDIMLWNSNISMLLGGTNEGVIHRECAGKDIGKALILLEPLVSNCGKSLNFSMS